MVDSTACPECGETLPAADTKFCPSCGARLQRASEDEQMLKLVSILFADVVSSTARAEQMFPEDVRELMSDFFDAMVEEIRAEGGRVEKFIGDAVMAVFGVPAAHEDDALRAVKAARRMLARLEKWNEGRETLHQIRIRIGVNTGDVLAAAPGSDLVVTGDSVNVAARLEQAAEAGAVLIGERTARVVRSHFVLEPVEPVKAKGKSDPVPAYLVANEKEVVEPRGVRGLSSPLIGREEELESLVAALERVEREHHAEIVTIVAEPGVGKSRLVREFVDSVALRTKVVGGRCLPYGEGVTLWPLGEILRAETGILLTDPAELALEKIIKLVRYSIPPEMAPDRDRTVAALAATIGLKDELDTFGPLDPRERLRELLLAWRALFRAMAIDGSVTAVIEDIHWADVTMLDVLDDLVQEVDAPVLFVCPTRPDLFTTRPTWVRDMPNRSSIDLDPLSHDDGAVLVTALLGLSELPAKLHDRILERSEGNPFFIEEILQRLIDEGHLVERDHRWTAQGDIADVDIPDNVQAVILARIDLLPTPAKRMIQNASVMGRVFWAGPLEFVGDDAEEILHDLEDRALVTQHISSSMTGQVEYSFKHILIRDVAYETLPRKRRAKAHVRVAQWVTDISGDRVEELAELLGHHYHQAFTYSKVDEHRIEARRLYGLAAQKAVQRFAIQQAETYGFLVVDLSRKGVERGAALETLGDLLCLALRMDGAWKVYRDALAELDETGSDHGMPARIAGKAALVPTRWDGSMRNPPTKEEVNALISTGLSAAGQDDKQARALLLMSKAFLQTAGYENMDDEGEASAEKALAIAEELGDPNLISAAIDARISWLMPEGLHGECHRINQQRLNLIPRLKDVKETCDVLMVAGWSAFFVGNYDEALGYGDECIKRAEGIDPGNYALGLANRVRYRFMTGDWDGALADLEATKRLVEEESALPPPYAWLAYAFAMFLHQLRGEASEAKVYEGLLESFDRETAVTELEGATARGAVWARALAHRGEAERGRRMIKTHKSVVLCAHLEAMCDVVAYQEAWNEVDSLTALCTQESARAELAALPCFADRLAGRAALAEGNLGEAELLLRSSSAGFDHLGAMWEAALCRMFLGEALSAERPGEAEAELTSALATFDRLRSVAERARAQQLLGNL